MTENFPKLMSDTKPKIQEPQRTQSRINAKNLHLGIFSKYRRSEIKKHTERSQDGGKGSIYIDKLKEIVIRYTERKI